MVDVLNITELEDYLRGLPHPVRISFAARTALRVIPNAFSQRDNTGWSFQGQATPIYGLLFLMSCFRACIVAGVAGTSVATSPALKASAHAAARSAAGFADTPDLAASDSAVASAGFAAASAAHSDADSARLAAQAVGSADASTADSQPRPAASAFSHALVTSLSKDLASGQQDTRQLFATPLWPEEFPETPADSLREFEEAAPGTPWSFWARWYRGMLDGKPLDWELQRRVALIDDTIWKAGPEAVAQEIARIESEFEATPLDQDTLRSHLTKLVETPLLFADSAESVSVLTTEAITRFKREAETNQLPDGFALFEQFPRVFGQISVTLRSDRDIEEKAAALQDEVNRLNTLVGQLRLDLADARLALAEALLSPAEAQRTRTFGELLQTTLTNVTLIGAIGMSTLGFFGVEAKDLKYEALKESLQGLAKDMETVVPAPEQDTLTPPVDV